MCNNPNLFSSLSPVNYVVRLGDHNQTDVHQAGFVSVNGLRLYCLFILEFRLSLISVAQLDSAGNRSTFFDGTCIVTTVNGHTILKATIDGGLYKVQLQADMHVTTRSGLQTSPPVKAKHAIQPTETKTRPMLSDQGMHETETRYDSPMPSVRIREYISPYTATLSTKRASPSSSTILSTKRASSCSSMTFSMKRALLRSSTTLSTKRVLCAPVRRKLS